MAGNYPDAPGQLFAVDVDGSVGFLLNSSNVLTALTPTQMARLTGEAWGSSGIIGVSESGTSYVGFIFPQLRDLTGYWYNTEVFWSGGLSMGAFQSSANTTNGLDGTWTNIDNPAMGGQLILLNSGTAQPAAPGFRTPRSISAAGVKAVRLGLTGTAGARYWSNLHIYGSTPAASTPDRLTLWHPTLDQELSGAALDFGDVIRSTVTDKTFRVKNRSATLTANTIELAMAALTDASPTYVSQYTMSYDGGGYAGTATIPSLAPGAISAVVTLRLTVSASAAVSVYRQRLTVAATTWS